MRALLLIVEGLGVGVTAEAGPFEHHGTSTLGRLRQAVPRLEIPSLYSLGLGEVLKGRIYDPASRRFAGSYGRMRPRCPEGDPTSTHWELAGIVNDRPFLPLDPLPEAFVELLSREAQTAFLVAALPLEGGLAAALECHAPAHVRTGKPILLSGPGSRLWIAAHEAVVPPARLHEICRVARRLGDEWRVGRISAVPFHGLDGEWKPTEGGHDYGAVPPHTLLNSLAERGFRVEGIGEATAHFARSGITGSHPAASNAEALAAIDALWDGLHNGLAIATLPDFNLLGREDPARFAEGLEGFDDWLSRFLETQDGDDLLIVTANHGSDPAFPGPVREEVPILLRYDGHTGPLGLRQNFGAVAATLAAFFEVPPLPFEPLTTFHRAKSWGMP